MDVLFSFIVVSFEMGSAKVTEFTCSVTEVDTKGHGETVDILDLESVLGKTAGVTKGKSAHAPTVPIRFCCILSSHDRRVRPCLLVNG